MLMKLGSLLDPSESQFPCVGSEAGPERDICPQNVEAEAASVLAQESAQLKLTTAQQ